jgi:alpha-tubulin suppressor-like RCC1 family protein
MAGVLYCWGSNSAGALGNGTTTNSSAPVAVTVAPGVSFMAVASGSGHSCAIALDGTAYCWGDNRAGQLGDGTVTRRLTPVIVANGIPGGVTFRSLSASFMGTCGVSPAGVQYCWGQAAFGQMGDGMTIVERRSPVTAVLGVPFVAIDAGARHTCAVRHGGAAHCWGNNVNGQLGDGTTMDRRTPVAVSMGGNTTTTISAGLNYTCAIVAPSGTLFCWGANSQGQLGDGTTTQRLTRVTVAGGVGFQSVSAGFNHTCAVRTGGGAYCWGTGHNGQLGDGGMVNSALPKAVLQTVLTSVGTGRAFSCGVGSASLAHCWGWNLYGKLGLGAGGNAFLPLAVTVP